MHAGSLEGLLLETLPALATLIAARARCGRADRLVRYGLKIINGGSYFLVTAGRVMRYASDMKYADGGGLTAAERARRD